MEMDVLPVAVLKLPDSGFFHGPRGRDSGVVGCLLKSYITDDGDFAHHAKMRGADRRLSCESVGTGRQVILVKRHSFDKVPGRFGFERRESLVTELFVRVPISLVDRIEQILGKSQER